MHYAKRDQNGLYDCIFITRTKSFYHFKAAILRGKGLRKNLYAFYCFFGFFLQSLMTQAPCSQNVNNLYMLIQQILDVAISNFVSDKKSVSNFFCFDNYFQSLPFKGDCSQIFGKWDFDIKLADKVTFPTNIHVSCTIKKCKFVLRWYAHRTKHAITKL